MRALAQGGGALLIGVDLPKPRAVLEAAYDDAAGVTAAFNRNVLAHVNSLIGSDFDPRQWRHHARYDEGAGRIEMHLLARAALVVRWPGGERRFAAAARVSDDQPRPVSQPAAALGAGHVDALVGALAAGPASAADRL